jgi:hypothetical protein
MSTIVIDDRDRPEVELSISGESFRIRRVVNAVRRIYGQYMERAGKEIERLGDLQSRLETGAATDQDVADATERVSEVVEQRDEAINECIRLILEKNGYEYDQQWWEENSDQYDRQHFVVAALNKDVKPGAGKKKAAG